MRTKAPNRRIGIAVLGLAIALSIPAAARPPMEEPKAGKDRYQQLLRQEAQRHGVPFALADAVMKVESGYNPAARGADGEVGLMQILPTTAALLGFVGSDEALAVPEANIAFGTLYLAEAWRLANQDICTTVMKYRAGH